MSRDRKQRKLVIFHMRIIVLYEGRENKSKWFSFIDHRCVNIVIDKFSVKTLKECVNLLSKLYFLLCFVGGVVFFFVFVFAFLESCGTFWAIRQCSTIFMFWLIHSEASDQVLIYYKNSRLDVTTILLEKPPLPCSWDSCVFPEILIDSRPSFRSNSHLLQKSGLESANILKGTSALPRCWDDCLISEIMIDL